MAWKPKFPHAPMKRAKRPFDVLMAGTVILAIILLSFGVDRVARYVTGESQIARAEAPELIKPIAPPATLAVNGSSITVVDGDTVRAHGIVYRLVGFDTPERGNGALCDKERALAEAASARLWALIVSGKTELQRVARACRSGTEGSQQCNFGRSCAYLRIDGRDVGDTLIREGLAKPFVCGATTCPPRKRWC